ncbi:hypothetical protein LV457_13355 [Mycobacterium sp. MYCO198283]|uniref:hypothetical protein n=1 Tax=Mycobacterium sp. MYCO198283 TaxID=2883505 RepID=UPI001E2BBB18|nr:hypothetical protein [Mycobacterium sp. MYCO198283]MCG5433266.1 hypothetical protein [Mycobacterium sp. MYCO198283]
MSNITGDDRIEDVAPGDMISVDRGDGERFYKVVHVHADNGDDDNSFLVTFDDDDGETFELRYVRGTGVIRALEAKWESEQSGRRDG